MFGFEGFKIFGSGSMGLCGFQILVWLQYVACEGATLVCAFFGKYLSFGTVFKGPDGNLNFNPNPKDYFVFR